MKSHFHQKITPHDIPSIFTQAYLKVATLEKDVSGFKSCGILPFQPDEFGEEDFAPAHCLIEQVVVEDRPTEDTPVTETSNDNPAQSVLNDCTEPEPFFRINF